MIENVGVRKTQIVLVEDNPADVELVRMALKEAGLDCDLTVLEDGAEALAMVRRRESHPGEFHPRFIPDLIVLDLNLPKKGGLEVLEAIRANCDFARTPVAILSSSSSPRERARIEEFGVDRFITKPLDLEGFLEIGLILKGLLRAEAAVGHTRRAAG
jgi:chemotaxis family two-component system response regulator Rcp1